MAYQPVLGPIIGHPSSISTGSDPIPLSGAGVPYVLLAVRLITPTPTGLFVIPLTAVSVMTDNRTAIEYRVVFNATISGNPLVYSRLDSLSVLEGAAGDGTQVVSDGISAAVGRFVPGDDERGLPRNVMPSPLAAPVLSTTFAYLVARSVGSGLTASVFARAEFDEIEVDETGTPLQRGVQLGS